MGIHISSVPTATDRIITGCGPAYITTPRDDTHSLVRGLLGKTGGCAAAWFAALCEVITLAMAAGVSKAAIAESLTGIRCPQDSTFLKSCPEAVATVLKGESQ